MFHKLPLPYLARVLFRVEGLSFRGLFKLARYVLASPIG
jgi:hypothetical protein